MHINPQHPLLNRRLKLWLHIAELILVHGVVILTMVKVFMGMSLRGTGRIGLAFGAKSLIFIFYQLMTEHIKFFKKWRSLKAYAIINAIEILFWGAVVFLTLQGIIGKTCEGTICALTWVVAVCAILMCPLTTWLFAICWFDFRAYRARGNLYPDEIEVVDVQHHRHEAGGDLPKYESAGGVTASTTEHSRNHSPDVRDPRYPMVPASSARGSSPHYDPRYQQYQHGHSESTEYHSGYARTPTQIV